MADSYSYTNLSDAATLYMTINGVQYDVVSFVASWAINQIPEAVVTLAAGRNAATLAKAQINNTASTLLQMYPVTITFHPAGDMQADGTQWPDKDVVIFDGYLTGCGYTKMNGTVHVSVNLVHWLIDLTFSSCLSSVSHVSNPADLTFNAVMQPLSPGGGATGEGSTLSQLVPHNAIEPLIQSDLWQAIKTMLCGMSQYNGFDPTCGADSVYADLLHTNSRATAALSRIEGPVQADQINTETENADTAEGLAAANTGSTTTGCDMAYTYGVALPLDVSQSQAYAGIADAIGGRLATDMWNLNFWDVLVGGYCPEFGLILCPGIDRAVVAADLPGYRADGDMWKIISPDAYEFVEQSMLLPRPLRAVVVHGNSSFDAGSGIGGNNCVSGVYASQAIADSDGVVMYTQVPPWIGGITTSGLSAGDMTGSGQTPVSTAQQPQDSSNSADDADLSPAAMVDTASAMLNQYAQMVFVREQLRGRNGTISGYLRFDIGPGSQIQLQGSPEQALADQDSLAGDLFAQVNRVTVEINCEAHRAATAFVLTALRNSDENQSDRTSSATHPFYGSSVMLGFPLTPIYNL